MPAPKLSICIVSYYERATLLAELLACLYAQAGRDHVQILLSIDDGSKSCGAKREEIKQAATGDYVCCIDDDDLVSPNYVSAILRAIAATPVVDAICIRGYRTSPPHVRNFAATAFDYRLGPDEIVNGVVWRTPGHLCPIRRTIAQSVPFPSVARGDDIPWGNALRPFIKTTARAGGPEEILYHYRFDPLKSHTPSVADLMERRREGRDRLKKGGR